MTKREPDYGSCEFEGENVLSVNRLGMPVFMGSPNGCGLIYSNNATLPGGFLNFVRDRFVLVERMPQLLAKLYDLHPLPRYNEGIDVSDVDGVPRNGVSALIVHKIQPDDRFKTTLIVMDRAGKEITHEFPTCDPKIYPLEHTPYEILNMTHKKGSDTYEVTTLDQSGTLIRRTWFDLSKGESGMLCSSRTS